MSGEGQSGERGSYAGIYITANLNVLLRLMLIRTLHTVLSCQHNLLITFTSSDKKHVLLHGNNKERK